MHAEKSHLRELALQQGASPQTTISTVVQGVTPTSAETDMAALAAQQSWQQCEDVLKGLEEQRQAMQRSLEDWFRRLERMQLQQLAWQSQMEGSRPPVVTALAPDYTPPILQQLNMSSRLAAAAAIDKGAAEGERIETVLLTDAMGDVNQLHVPQLQEAWGQVAASTPYLQTQTQKCTEEPRHAPSRPRLDRKKTTIALTTKKRPWSDRLTHAVRRVLADSGLDKAIKACQKKDRNLERRFLWKFTRSMPFTLLASSMILVNAAFVGAEASHNFGRILDGRNVDAFWGYMEIVFSIWFSFELVVRLAAEKFTFFFGSEWKMNLLDCSLVVTSVMGAIVNPAGTASKATLARILRLFRFARIFRVVRVMKAFHSLRLLAFSIMESMGALFWCALIVFTAIYLFAVFFLDGATEFLRENPAERTGETAAQLQENFGSVMRAMICLFMTISGGIDWKDATTPLRQVHWLYEPIFVFYAFVMLFGVLNVVVATFVENTAQISRKDKEAMVFNEMRRVSEYAECIKQFFHDADTDRSGMLSWEEFERHLDDNRVQAYFQALELDVSEAHLLFELLDQDDSSEVEIDEFVGGCMRLKGTARSLDVNMIMRRIDRLSARLEKISDMSKVVSGDTEAVKHL